MDSFGGAFETLLIILEFWNPAFTFLKTADKLLDHKTLLAKQQSFFVKWSELHVSHEKKKKKSFNMNSKLCQI